MSARHECTAAATPAAVQIRVLGPVALANQGREIAIRSPKQRVVLVMLALSRRAGVDALADALWREDPPASVTATIHTLVSRLRRAIDDAGGGIVIRSEGAGYVLEAGPDAVDVRVFESLVAHGRSALDAGAAAAAADQLRAALGLWRGSALDDVAEREFACAMATRLEETRLRAVEELAEAELAAGRPGAALDALEPIIAANPFREGLRAQQMLALYRSGRQADALAAFQELRRCLADELGLSPTPTLCALEGRILRQAPELDASSPPPARAGDAEVDGRENSAPGTTMAFLFTDIESSTARWDGDPTAMRTDLARHDEILHGAITTGGGHLFTHTGDGLGAAFPTVSAAISAAVAGQRGLASATWRGVPPLSVRMAVHVGAAQARAGTYLGPALNRTARLLGEARGGEILCSHAAVDLVRDELPADVGLAEVGERRLRGLARPESVWRVLHPGIADLEPPREAAPNRAPEVTLTSFVGRARELAELADLLRGTRLLTITGLGGAGKTRLGLEVAARARADFVDGVNLVELAPVSPDRPVAGAVLAALGLDAGGPSAEAAEERLERALVDRHKLLVLDNCEHLLEPVSALVARVLLRCPAVTVLATSREVLSVAGEVAWAAPGLSLPPESAADPAELQGSDAAALFLARARVARPGFGVSPANVAAIAAVCRRLDGLPLALELAAARVRVLGVGQLAEKLDDRFRLLTSGPRSAPTRHQTLAACVDWSYEALPEAEAHLLRRLSVFPQTFDLDAAAAVAGDDTDPLDVLDRLARLVDKSLVGAEGAGETARYRLLETVRHYAALKLGEEGAASTAATLHRRHFVGVVQRWREEGEDFLATTWLERTAEDKENFHAALLSAVGSADTQSVSALVGGMWIPWFVTGTAPAILAQVRPESLGCADPGLHIHALIGYVALPKLSAGGSLEDMVPLLERALAVAEDRGSPDDRGLAKLWVGYITLGRGDVPAARALLQEAITDFAAGRSGVGLSMAHHQLGWVEMSTGDTAGAVRHFRAALEIVEPLAGHETTEITVGSSLALAEASIGEVDAALQRARRAVQTARRASFPGALVVALVRAAEAAAVAGVPARDELEEALLLLQRQGGRQWVASALRAAALLHAAESRAEQATRLFGGAVGVARDLGEDPDPLPVLAPLVHAARARLAVCLGADFDAQEAAGAALSAHDLLRLGLRDLSKT